MADGDELGPGEALVALGVGLLGGLVAAAVLEALFGRRSCPNCNRPVDAGISNCPYCYKRLG